MSEPEGVRLQKVLAAAGVGSRRACEEMIADGRVEVNGSPVTIQGMRVDPQTDVIRVDGSRIPPPRHHQYIALNKPRGVVSTMEDPEGRRCLADLLAGHRERLFHVGRLDTETEGLLLLTNDGDFAHKLAHPSFEVPKTYLAQVSGSVEIRTINKLRAGIMLDDGPVKPEKVTLTDRAANKSMVEIVLHEGRNHIVRRTFESVGHPVRRLARTQIGPVRLGKLPTGQHRDLTRQELGALMDLVGG